MNIQRWDTNRRLSAICRAVSPFPAHRHSHRTSRCLAHLAAKRISYPSFNHPYESPLHNKPTTRDSYVLAKPTCNQPLLMTAPVAPFLISFSLVHLPSHSPIKPQCTTLSYIFWTFLFPGVSFSLELPNRPPRTTLGSSNGEGMYNMGITWLQS